MKLANSEGGGVFEAGHVGEHYALAGADAALHFYEFIVGVAEFHFVFLQFLAVFAEEEEAVGAGACVVRAVGDAYGIVYYVAGNIDVGLQT